MRHVRAVPVLAAAMAMSGCGSAASPSADAGPLQMRDGEVLVTCAGSTAFPASRVSAAVAPESVDAAAVDTALADLTQRAGIDAPAPLQRFGSGTTWTVLWTAEESPDGTVGLLLTPPGREPSLADDWYATLGSAGAEWSAQSWGERCLPHPALATGTEWVQLALPDGAGGADLSDATEIPVLVSEWSCTGGRDPGPYLHEPVVMEDSDSVTIYWTTEQPVGDQTCPGNPWVERTVTLSAPLGARLLFDGSSYPPAPMTEVRSAD